MSTLAQLDAVLAALAAGDGGAAIAALADLEWTAFKRGRVEAGELAYARTCAEQGDLVGAADIVRQLARAQSQHEVGRPGRWALDDPGRAS